MATFGDKEIGDEVIMCDKYYCQLPQKEFDNESQLLDNFPIRQDLKNAMNIVTFWRVPNDRQLAKLKNYFPTVGEILVETYENLNIKYDELRDKYGHLVFIKYGLNHPTLVTLGCMLDKYNQWRQNEFDKASQSVDNFTIRQDLDKAMNIVELWRCPDPRQLAKLEEHFPTIGKILVETYKIVEEKYDTLQDKYGDALMLKKYGLSYPKKLETLCGMLHTYNQWTKIKFEKIVFYAGLNVVHTLEGREIGDDCNLYKKSPIGEFVPQRRTRQLILLSPIGEFVSVGTLSEIRESSGCSSEVVDKLGKSLGTVRNTTLYYNINNVTYEEEEVCRSALEP